MTQEIFEKLVNSSLDGILAFDQECRYTVWNPAMERFFGVSSAEVLGQYAFDVFPLFKETGEDQFYLAALAGEAVIAPERPYTIPATGQPGFFEGHYFPLWNPSGQISGGMAIIYDVTERKRVEAAERTQRELAEAFHDVATALNSTLNFDELLERILINVGRVMPHDAAAIMLVEADMVRVVGNRDYTESGQVPALGRRFRLTDLPIQAQMAENGQALVIPDTQAYSDWLDMPGASWLRSYAGTPIRLKGEVVGFLNLASVTPNFFTAGHGRRLQAFAEQVGIAIGNARLLEAEARRRGEAETLRDATAALTTALDLSQVLESILIHLAQVVPYDSSCVFLLQGNKLHAVAGRGFPDPTLIIGLNFPADDALFLELQSTRRPLCLPDARTDPRFHAWGGTEHIRGWMGVPLIGRGQVIGYVTVDSRQVAAYGQVDAVLAQAFANQAAVVIENARLFAETRRRAEQLEALHQVSQDLAVLSDLDTLLRQIVERAIQLVGGDAGGIYLYRPERQALEWVVAVGERVVPMGLMFSPGEGLSGKVWTTGKPLIIDDYQNWPGRSPQWFDTPVSVMGAPIQWGDECLGVLSVRAANARRHFTADDATLLGQFATQAAIAIQNARLYQQAQQEITERKRVEETLAEERNLLRTLIDNLPDYIYVKDTECRFVIGNIAVAQMMGASGPDELIGKTDFDFHPPELAAQYYATEQALIRSGQSLIDYEEPLIDPAGNQRWLSTTQVALRDSRGQIIGLVGISRDITGHKQTEAELNSYREHLEALIQERTAELQQAMLEAAAARDRTDAILRSVADGLIVTDLADKVILANPAAEILLGTPVAEMLGRQISTTVKDDRLQALIRRALDPQTGTDEVDIEFAEPATRRQKVIRARTAPVDDRQGQSLGTVTIIQDVTRLREVDRFKTELLTMAAHELRTPLTSILGYSEILLTRNLDQTRHQRYLRLINDQSSHLARIIADLLDVSRLEAGTGLELKLKPVDIAQLMQETALPFAELTDGYEIRLEGLAGLPPILGDPFRLMQLGQNLLSNAVKFSPGGGTITLRGRLRPGFLEVSLQDEGIGLTPEQQDYLFEPFYRANTSHTTVSGIGLGLAICKLIVEQHGGEIWLQSTQGVGTTVYFTLPLAGDRAQ